MYRLILGLAAATLFAQQIPVDVEMANRAKQLLGSTKLSDKAWGARLGASLRLPGIEELLIAELRANQKFSDAVVDGPEYAYIQALFDSLIELEAKVPENVIRPYWPRWRAEVIILLARSGRETATLLELQTERLSDVEWLAISNLLLERHSAKLFERMLDGLPVTHKFWVIDPARPCGEAGGIACGFGKPGPRRAFPTGFPAISLYRLTGVGANRAELIAHGPQKVYSQRVPVPTDGFVEWHAAQSSPTITSRSDFRLEYIAQLGDRPLEMVRKLFQPETTIPWSNPTNVTRSVEKHLDDQAYDLRNFIIGTKLRNGTDASSIRLVIEPKLIDCHVGSSAPARPKPRELVIDLR